VRGSVVSLHKLRLARYRMQTRVLHALSAIVRHSETAQNELLAVGGADALRNMLTPFYSATQLAERIPACAAAATPEDQAGASDSSRSLNDLLCLSRQELAQELELHSSVVTRAAALLYDIATDFLVNARDGAGLASAALFHAVSTPEACSVYPLAAASVVNVSMDVPAERAANFHVHHQLSPNFGAMEARVQLLRLCELLLTRQSEEAPCGAALASATAREAFRMIAAQQEWLYRMQLQLESERAGGGERSADLMLSDYYGESVTLALALSEKSRQRSPLTAAAAAALGL
jgi:hypothetical protein